jgi:heat shock protein HtpX
MKRIFLFLLTNIAVMALLSGVLSALGLDRALHQNGLNMRTLMITALILGFTGSLISLALSKTLAKMSTGAKVIETPQTPLEHWLVDTVHRFAQAEGLAMPEVALYEGEPNAFATGATRNSSLVAVSTGLLELMNREEAEAVIAHEVSHIANGDMVTMTLIQGVVNTFVFFLSRVIAFAVEQFLRRGDARGAGRSGAYYLTAMICQVVLGLLASLIVAWFSRQREFRADAGAAKLMRSPKSMVAALQRLGQMESGALPASIAAAGISNRPSWSALFSTHPPLEERIAALSTSRSRVGFVDD